MSLSACLSEILWCLAEFVELHSGHSHKKDLLSTALKRNYNTSGEQLENNKKMATQAKEPENICTKMKIMKQIHV